jgi:flagellar biosynthesis/type III secretory pathway protein FliH
VEPEPVEDAPLDIEALTLQLASKAKAEAEACVAVERAELATAIETMNQAADTLKTLRREALDQAGADIAALVLALTERVLDKSLALHPDALRGVITSALDHLPEAEEVVVNVSPGMLEMVSRNQDPRIHLRPDANLKGGCVVRTPHVTLDATLEAAMSGVDTAVRTWLTEQPWVTEWMLEESDR